MTNEKIKMLDYIKKQEKEKSRPAALAGIIDREHEREKKLAALSENPLDG